MGSLSIVGPRPMIYDNSIFFIGNFSCNQLRGGQSVHEYIKMNFGRDMSFPFSVTKDLILRS